MRLDGSVKYVSDSRIGRQAIRPQKLIKVSRLIITLYMISRTFSHLAKTTLSLSKHQRPLYAFSRGQQFETEEVKSTQLSTNEVISKNVGVNRFLTKVYNTTGLSIVGALSTSWAVLNLPMFAGVMMPMAGAGILMTLGGFIPLSFMKPQYLVNVEKINNNEKIEFLTARNSILRQALYGMGTIGLGLSAAPLMAFAAAVNPSIIPTCLGLTTAIFGGASLMAYRMPKDSMLKYGGVLGGSLLGLIGLQLVGLASSFIFGPNPFIGMMFHASNYFAVGLFTAFIAYDTHMAIKLYEMREPDHLGMATQFLLNFWNIFTSLLRIFSSSD